MRAPARNPGVSFRPAERRALHHGSSHDGQPLDATSRATFEPRFGHSLSDIRIFADQDAARAAAGIGARAFTVGSDIVFNADEYRPGSFEGEALLAHELTHAVQNERASRSAAPLGALSSDGDQAEVEAAHAYQSAPGVGSLEAVSAPAAVISRAPEAGKRAKQASDFTSLLGTGSNLGESWYEGLIQSNWHKIEDPTKVANRFATRDTLGTYGDVFGAMSGAYGFASSVDRLMNGGGGGAALDAGKGALDTVSSVAGLAGKSGVEGITGMASSAIDVGRGLHTAISSDDLDEATQGAYQLTGGIASGIASLGDYTKNPMLMAGGRAAGLGLKAGEAIVSKSDKISKERGYFHDDYGNAQSGSSEAADWGRSVDDLFGHGGGFWDKVGGIAGGAVAIGGGIANSAYTYGRRALGAIGDFFSGPSEKEMEELKKNNPWIKSLMD